MLTPEQLKQKPFEEISRFNMKTLIQMKESQMKRKRNPPHAQKRQNKILSLISTEDGQETNMTETLQVHHGNNETTHDAENPSEANYQL